MYTKKWLISVFKNSLKEIYTFRLIHFYSDIACCITCEKQIIYILLDS